MKSKCILLAGLLTMGPAAVYGQDDTEVSTLSKELDKAKARVDSENTYHLRYDFEVGEKLVYRVEHLATVDTRIQGNRQTSKSRSTSTKVWQVQKLNDDDTVQIVHSIEEVDMWSQVNGRQPVRYNSSDQEEPPPEYETVAETVGKPLAVVTIDPQGNIVEREDDTRQVELGVGGLVVPLPAEPVKIGATWSVPSAVPVRLPDGKVKVIKTRQLHELKSVRAGVALVSVQTQVLTPVNDARVQSQLMQRLTRGAIKFDIDAGRMLSKEIQWDESVVGFSGPDSSMKYLAEFSEKLVPTEVQTARKP